MADLDDLLGQIPDEGLRSQIFAGVELLKRQMRFGLVFERHIPESVRVYGAAPRIGDVVQLRADATGADEYTVTKVTARTVTMISEVTGVEAKARPREVVPVKRFGEPVYPALRPTGSLRRSDDRASHTAICGENFHALQLLRYLYRGQLDCIYIDPPYNTGDGDWKYNNRYIDSNDRWMHSKWLSFMEKRLAVAKDLLRPEDGVLIVTIDEHEVHRLGVLLEQIFRGYEVYTVSIVHNPKGKAETNVSRVNEYVLICAPKFDGKPVKVLTGLPGDEADAMVGKRTTDHLDDEEDDEDLDDDEAEDSEADDQDDMSLPFPQEDLPYWERRHARRRGAQSSYRQQRKRQFYPLYIDRDALQVVRAGDWIPLDEDPCLDDVDGLQALWPIDAEGNERVWRLKSDSMQAKIDEGRVVLGKEAEDGTGWTVNIWYPKTERKKYKTVWWNPKHDAGTHGTTLLNKMLERRAAFPFAKSLYAVRDTLLTVVRDRPNALILDFFAGSATTLHATALINAQYGGNRRCVVVSNNEVSESTARQLQTNGHLPGDERFERHGIFRDVTRPRIEIALSGTKPSGKPLEGSYVGGGEMADGFGENVEFFDLVYLDRDDVRQGTHFSDIEPSLWLMAGGIGERGDADGSEPFALAPNSNYAVLFDRSHFAAFARALANRDDITHVFLITDSSADYNDMCDRLPRSLKTSMLYRDYLTNFRINTVEAWS